ncbi:CD209 antigen protein 2, partial [Biomphalaria glabrata]
NQVKMATPSENPPLQEGIELVERKSVVPGEPEATNPNVAADTPKAAADTPKAAADTPKAAADTPKAAADTPKAAAGTPKAAAGTPKAAAGTPKAAAGTPKAAAGTPKAAAGTPKAAAGTPKAAAGTPKAAAGTQKAAAGTQKAAADTPKAAVDTPKAAVDTPKAAVDTPKAAADTPKAAADTPKAAADTPNAAADTPNAAADTPNAAADTPNAAADTPNAAADTPNAAADTPNAAADTPNAAADTQQPAETNPESPVDSPIAFDADYPNVSPFFGREDQYVDPEQRLISENDPELPRYSRYPPYPVGRSYLPLGLDDEDAPGPYSPPSEESMYNLNPGNPNVALKKDVRTSTYCNLIGLSLVFIGLMASLFGWFNQLDGKQDTSIALADTVYRQMCGAIMAPNFNISYHEKCFCFYSKPMSWENARAFCRSQGRDNFLAEIQTTEANIFLNAILQASNPGYGVWLGGLRQGKGSWTWNRTGLRFSKFQPEPSPWSQHSIKAPSTEADDDVRECLEVTKKFDFNYAWKNTDCEARRMFLCSHTRYLPTCKCKGL